MRLGTIRYGRVYHVGRSSGAKSSRMRGRSEEHRGQSRERNVYGKVHERIERHLVENGIRERNSR